MRKAFLAVAALATLATVPVAAQGGFRFGVSGGATMPMGDLGEAVKTGWGGAVTLMMRAPEAKVGFGIEAQYNRFGYEDLGDIDLNASLNTYGAMARLDFAAGDAFYLLGGAGLFRSEVTADDDGPDLSETNNTDFAVQGGLGFNFGSGFFIEGKFVNIFSEGQSTNFVPINIGIRF
jgi:opacity protein-like surface antigen